MAVLPANHLKLLLNPRKGKDGIKQKCITHQKGKPKNRILTNDKAILYDRIRIKYFISESRIPGLL
jgi:hypothetical protein